MAAQSRNGDLCVGSLDGFESLGFHVTEEEAFGKRRLFTRSAGGFSFGFDSEELAAVLDGLSAKEAEALLLGIGLGLSTKELAESLGIKESSAKVRKAKALAKARRAVKNGKN